MPPDRNITADFLRQFLAGKKGLLKAAQVVHLKQDFRFREMTLANLLERYPKPTEAAYYLPDERDLARLDRGYALNVL